MITLQKRLLVAGFLILISVMAGQAQNRGWKPGDCIGYAIGKNVRVQKSELTSSLNPIDALRYE